MPTVSPARDPPRTVPNAPEDGLSTLQQATLVLVAKQTVSAVTPLTSVFSARMDSMKKPTAPALFANSHALSVTLPQYATLALKDTFIQVPHARYAPATAPPAMKQSTVPLVLQGIS